jgi:hypothetical protein
MAVRLDHSPERTIVRDIPRGMWVFGSVFVLSGLAVLIGLVGSRDWASFSMWVRLAILALGFAHLAAGCYSVWRYEATVTTFDHRTGEGSHEVRRPFRRASRITRFRVHDVRTVELRRDTDSDGDPMYQLRLWLAGSRVLPLQGQPAHGIERGERDAGALRDALRLSVGAAE